MDYQPAVSIIIPAYNAEKYLAQAIESVLAQTYSGAKEILVIDDGSTDTTALIAQSFPEITYYYQNNSGEAAARNRGLELAKGEFITWLDGDDWYEDGKLQRQYDYLEQNTQYDFVYSDFKTFDESTGEYGVLKAELYLEGCNNFLATILFRQIIPGIAGIMFRRKCIESGCRYDEARKYAPDYSFCLQLLMNGFTAGYIPESLYGYRRHSGNVTNAHQCQRISEIDQVKSLGLKKIKEIVEATTFSEDEKQLLHAKILLKIAKYEVALDILKESQSLRTSCYITFYKANCYYLLGEYKKAKEFYEHLLGGNNLQAEIHNNLGCSYVMVGDIREGDEHFNAARRLRASYMDPKLNQILIQTIYNQQSQTNSEFMEKLHFTLFELRTQLQNYTTLEGI